MEVSWHEHNQDLDQILEVSQFATQQEIEEARKVLALVWDPDRLTAGTKAHQIASEKMKAINCRVRHPSDSEQACRI